MIYTGSKRVQRVGVIALGMAVLGMIALGRFVSVVGASTPLASAADKPSDAWLTTTAKITILTSIGTRRSTVQVDTMNSTMTLYGKVTSPADRANAEKVARSIEGVREVRNFLMVAPAVKENASAISDSDIHSEVAVALIASGLKKDGALSGSNVSVLSVYKGRVLLTGTAISLTAHLRAIETAKNVRGVLAVRSDIQSPDTSAVRQARFLGR